MLRNAEVIREVQDQNGGVIVSFPRQNSGDSKVTIKGSKNCAESAKERILEIVGDLVAFSVLSCMQGFRRPK